jgi:hypothetical protein
MMEERGGYSGYDAGGGEQPVAEAATPNEYEQTDNAYQRGAPRRGYSADPAMTEADTGANDPDPLGFGELANEPPLDLSAYGAPAASGETPPAGYAGYNAPAAAQPGGPADKAKWATDYAAFHANFSTAHTERGVPSVEWGELSDLREMNEAAEAHALDESADPYRQKTHQIAERMGEVRWQMEFMGLVESPTGGQLVQFRVPEPPTPLQIEFLVDEQDDAQRWAALRPRTPVNVLGRITIMQPNKITVRVRLDESSANQPAAADSPRALPGGVFIPTPDNPR